MEAGLIATREAFDPVALKEDAARAKEMMVILKEARKAEDRREKLMRQAKTRSAASKLEKRFTLEREQDARKIRDLSEEREAVLRASLARRRSPAAAAREGRTLDFVKGTTTIKERTTMGSNNLELQFFRDIYAKLDTEQPRRAPPAARRAGGSGYGFGSASASGGGGFGSSRPTQSAVLREKRDLLMRLSDLVVQEHSIVGAPSNRSTYSAYAPQYSRPGSARSVASRATSVASVATVGSRAPPPPARPSRVPRLRM